MSTGQISDLLLKAMEENAQLFSSLNSELKSQLKTVIDSQVENMGLVTREEFDTLRASLNRSLERIEKLENELNQED